MSTFSTRRRLASTFRARRSKARTAFPASRIVRSWRLHDSLIRATIGPRKAPAPQAGSTATMPVAVGTALTGGPPLRSQRAGLPHWAPALGSGCETHVREWVQDAHRGYPSVDVLVHLRPG